MDWSVREKMLTVMMFVPDEKAAFCDNYTCMSKLGQCS